MHKALLFTAVWACAAGIASAAAPTPKEGVLVRKDQADAVRQRLQPLVAQPWMTGPRGIRTAADRAVEQWPAARVPGVVFPPVASLRAYVSSWLPLGNPTLKAEAEGNGGQARHVSGPELLEGFRDFALEQFGPMASTLMTEWGVRKCQDVGDMVFHLIEEQVFGKQDSDCREDFSEIFDFEEALVKPFLPKRKLAADTPVARRARAAS